MGGLEEAVPPFGLYKNVYEYVAVVHSDEIEAIVPQAEVVIAVFLT